MPVARSLLDGDVETGGAKRCSGRGAQRAHRSGDEREHDGDRDGDDRGEAGGSQAPNDPGGGTAAGRGFRPRPQ